MLTYFLSLFVLHEGKYSTGQTGKCNIWEPNPVFLCYFSHSRYKFPIHESVSRNLTFWYSGEHLYCKTTFPPLVDYFKKVKEWMTRVPVSLSLVQATEERLTLPSEGKVLLRISCTPVKALTNVGLGLLNVLYTALRKLCYYCNCF